jgi:hypothetical protein
VRLHLVETRHLLRSGFSAVLTLNPFSNFKGAPQAHEPLFPFLTAERFFPDQAVSVFCGQFPGFSGRCELFCGQFDLRNSIC